MALSSNYARKTNNLSDQTRSIRSSLQSTRRSLNNINKVFDRRTRIKSSIFRTRQLTNNRKLEALRRKEQRDAINSAKLSISRTPGPIARIRNSGKTFLGRILDFISSLAIGWILSNLPMWIAYGKAFIKRIDELWRALTGFVRGMSDFVRSFGNTLSGVLGDIAAFDFASIPSTIENGMNDLENSVDEMRKQFEEGFSLFQKPLIDESELEQPQAEPSLMEQSGINVPAGTEFGPSMEATGGTKASPYIYSGFRTARRPGHKGIDISGGPWRSGAPISVIKPGVVVQAEDLGSSGWGKYVVIKHDDGTYSLYGHLNSINVRRGEKIENKSGSAKVIGTVGSTGRSTGPHLHFELGTGWTGGVLTGHVNPTAYIDSYTRVGGDVKTTQMTAVSPQQSLMGPKAGKRFSISELVALAKQAGFKGDNAAIAAAIAYAESTGNSMAHNKKRPDNSYGLWQINMIDDLGPSRRKQFGLRSNEDLFDPLTNAKVAYKMSGGSNFNPWTTFNPRDRSTPKYLTFLPEARKASGIAPSQYTQGEFIPMQQPGDPGAITPSREGEVVIAQFPSSGLSVPSGMEGGVPSSGEMPIPTAPSESEVLNNFIKKKLLVELSYL